MKLSKCLSPLKKNDQTKKDINRNFGHFFFWNPLGGSFFYFSEGRKWYKEGPCKKGGHSLYTISIHIVQKSRTCYNIIYQVWLTKFVSTQIIYTQHITHNKLQKYLGWNWGKSAWSNHSGETAGSILSVKWFLIHRKLKNPKKILNETCL